MKKILIITLIITFVIPLAVFAQKMNVEITDKGEIGEINYKNISKTNKASILAQLVSDDVIKKAITLANEKKYQDAHQLISAVTYLDYNNENALELQFTFLKELIKNESDKLKLYKNTISEAKHVIKSRSSSHNIDFKRSIILAKSARSLYETNTEEYKKANNVVVQIESLLKIEIPTQDRINKLLHDANKATKKGQYIRAINIFSVLYYAERSTIPLIRITKLIQLI